LAFSFSTLFPYGPDIGLTCCNAQLCFVPGAVALNRQRSLTKPTTFLNNPKNPANPDTKRLARAKKTRRTFAPRSDFPYNNLMKSF